MITKDEIDKKIREQLAREFNSSPDDFSKDENIITDAVLHEKRRHFSDKRFFLQMVSFGNNAVISADEKIHPWLKEWIREKKGFWLLNSIITMSSSVNSGSTGSKWRLLIICSCLKRILPISKRI